MSYPYLEKLNPDQRQAAECKTHCLVIAAPGSGKTGTLASKAAFLLSDGVTRVAAVTFTRDSALELRHRILKLAGESALPRLIVGTFHSVDMLMAFPPKKLGMGSDILKEIKSPFNKKWILASNGSRISYILRAMKDAGVDEADTDLKEATKLIELSKSGVAHPNERHANMAIVYDELLSRHGEIDFQDILLLTNKALKDGTLTPLPVDYLLLDEFQDTDQTQLDWAFIHGERSKITAVGDEDQSIYGFRNALGNSGMTAFQRHFNAEKIILGVNYRSRSEILSPAGTLIAKNFNRQDKVLFSAKGPGGTILWDKFHSSEAEAMACALFSQKALREKASMCVLSRTNRKLESIEAAMMILGVPCKLAEGESIMDSPEYELYKSAIAAFTKPTAKAIDLLLAWAKVPELDLQEIHRVFGVELKERSINDFKGASISPEGRKIWRNLSVYAPQWADSARNGLFTLMHNGIKDWLNAYTTDKRSLSRIEIISNMFMPLEGKTLLDAVERLSAIEKNSKSKTPDESDAAAVFLTTAHGSKGLEFDRVWIAGADSETFPESEEERRLFYVAMTRAREHLVISTSGKNTQSLFVDQCGVPRAPVDHFPIGTPLARKKKV